MLLIASTYFINSEGINGWRNFFFRRELKAAAKKYEIPYERVEDELAKVRNDNPGKNLVIVFSKNNDEASVLTVEERNAHFDRILEQLNRTGLCTGAPL